MGIASLPVTFPGRLAIRFPRTRLGLDGLTAARALSIRCLTASASRRGYPRCDPSSCVLPPRTGSRDLTGARTTNNEQRVILFGGALRMESRYAFAKPARQHERACRFG